MTKLTKKVALEAAVSALTANTNKEYRVAGTDDVFTADEVVAKLVAMMEQLDAKNAAPKKPTKTQVANEATKELVVEVLHNAGDKLTVSELQTKDATLAAMSNQKVAALIRQLVKEGKVERFDEGRKAYFKA